MRPQKQDCRRNPQPGQKTSGSSDGFYQRFMFSRSRALQPDCLDLTPRCSVAVTLGRSLILAVPSFLTCSLRTVKVPTSLGYCGGQSEHSWLLERQQWVLLLLLTELGQGFANSLLAILWSQKIAALLYDVDSPRRWMHGSNMAATRHQRMALACTLEVTTGKLEFALPDSPLVIQIQQRCWSSPLGTRLPRRTGCAGGHSTPVITVHPWGIFRTWPVTMTFRSRDGCFSVRTLRNLGSSAMNLGLELRVRKARIFSFLVVIAEFFIFKKYIVFTSLAFNLYKFYLCFVCYFLKLTVWRWSWKCLVMHVFTVLS